MSSIRHQRRCALGMLLVGIAGCSGPSSAPSGDGGVDVDRSTSADRNPDGPATSAPRNTSGTRLRARYITTPEGHAVFLGWYDQQLKESCAFSTSSDGTSRCLPVAASAGSGAAYLDASCTQPAVVVTPCPGATTYFAFAASNGCRSSELRPVLDKASFAGKVYNRTGSSCTAGAVPSNPDLYYLLGPPIDEKRYVEAAQVLEPKGQARLQPYVLKAADGSIQRASANASEPARYYDSAQKVDCSLDFGESGKYRCLPSRVMTPLTDIFGDAACTQAAAQYSPGPPPPCGASTDPPLYIKQMTAGECGQSAANRLFSHGAKLASLYSTTTGKCAPYTSGPGSTVEHYLVGPEVDITSFVELTQIAPGSGRLRARLWATSDGIQESRGTFDDRQLNLRCRFSRAEDSKFRCLPVDAQSLSPNFRDDKCTTPLVLTSAPASCPLPSLVSASTSATGSCDRLVTLYTLGAPYPSGQPVYYKNVSECQTWTPASTYRFFAVGEKVNPGVYAEGSESN